MKRGKSAVRSHPAEMLFAEMLVPICAMMNAIAMNATPARCVGPSADRKNADSSLPPHEKDRR